MALSNIFREPRREITESVVGLSIFGVFLYGDYHLTKWALAELPHGGPPLPIAMILVGVGIFFACGFSFLILVLTHALGDAICNALQRNGVHLRPRVRHR